YTFLCSIPSSQCSQLLPSSWLRTTPPKWIAATAVSGFGKIIELTCEPASARAATCHDDPGLCSVRRRITIPSPVPIIIWSEKDLEGYTDLPLCESAIAIGSLLVRRAKPARCCE